MITEQEINNEAKKVSDLSVILSDFPHHKLSVEYGFKKGVEWANKQQLPPTSIDEISLTQFMDKIAFREIRATPLSNRRWIDWSDWHRYLRPTFTQTIKAFREASELYAQQFKDRIDELEYKLTSCQVKVRSLEQFLIEIKQECLEPKNFNFSSFCYTIIVKIEKALQQNDKSNNI